jgi:hypothetical protein
VVDADPENLTSIRALDRLFSQSERWTDLVGVLAREAEITPSAEEVLEVKYRLGRVLQSKLGDVERALVAYRDVITLRPSIRRPSRHSKGSSRRGFGRLTWVRSSSRSIVRRDSGRSWRAFTKRS